MPDDAATPAPTNANDADSVVRALDASRAILLESPGRRGSADHLPDHGRLLVTGDLHDNPFHFDAVIKLARLGASPDHHVVLHELIHGERLLNGMDFSYRMLVRVADLVAAHPGQVHPMLANHEIAQVTGKGVSKGAGNSVELFREALEYVFGDRSVEVEQAIDRFVRAWPLAVRSGPGGLLCAHSLPDPRAMKHFDPAVLDRPLEPEDLIGPKGPAYAMTWGRGYTMEDVERLAEAWDVGLFCLGHDHVESGIESRGSRVIVINSDHEAGRVLPVDLSDPPAAQEAPMHAIPLASIIET